MPKAIILTGLPLTGKTTYAKELEAKGYTIISAQEHVDKALNYKGAKSLSEIIYDVDKSFQKEMMKILNKKVDVVFDGDFLAREDRKDIIKRLQSRRYNIASVYCELPIDTTELSNYLDKLSKCYPNMNANTLMDMMDQLEIPSTQEGFHLTLVLTPNPL